VEEHINALIQIGTVKWVPHNRATQVFPGRGHRLPGHRQAGNVMVRFAEDGPDPIYRRSALRPADLLVEHTVSLVDALAGLAIELPRLGGGAPLRLDVAPVPSAGHCEAAPKNLCLLVAPRELSQFLLSRSSGPASSASLLVMGCPPTQVVVRAFLGIGDHTVGLHNQNTALFAIHRLPGDLYVTFTVEFPTTLDPSRLRALRELLASPDTPLATVGSSVAAITACSDGVCTASETSAAPGAVAPASPERVAPLVQVMRLLSNQYVQLTRPIWNVLWPRSRL